MRLVTREERKPNIILIPWLKLVSCCNSTNLEICALVFHTSFFSSKCLGEPAATKSMAEVEPGHWKSMGLN